MAIAIVEQQRAIQDSVRRWAADAGTLGAVRALEPAASPTAPPPGSAPLAPAADRYRTELAKLGVFSLALPEQVGGDGAPVADLAAAIEELTNALAPGPITPTLLAGLLLARHTDLPAVHALASSVADGRESAAVALDAGTVTGDRHADGSLAVTGRTGPVLGAGAASWLLLAAETPEGPVGCLLEAGEPGVEVLARTPVDFSRPVADVVLTGVVVPAERVIPWAAPAVRDTAALLFAVEAAAVAGWCLRTAAAYAKVRRQFGRPIGSFQAVKHLCANMLCRSQRATALAWDAARAFDTAPDEFPLTVAAAAAVGLDAGVDNAKDCIQVLGGIGFTWEHDAHLYLRRALALRQLLGGSARWRARAAAYALDGARRTLTADLPDPGETPAAVRETARRIAALPAERQRAALAETGYLAPHWPAPYGLDATPAQQLVIDAELRRAGVPRPDLGIGAWAVPTILSHGSRVQVERFAGPSLRGEMTWCQLFSEPEAGSDLAALRTRAERVDGGWRLSGQKVWTSLAGEADWAICLARTDPTVPRHRGLTYFLVAMRSPGIEIRPLREITGRSMFNEVFLDEVFVADECVLGAPGDGWRLARATLDTERVAMGRGSSFGDDVERLIEAVAAAGLAVDPGVRERLGELVAGGLASSLLDLRATLRQLEPERGHAVGEWDGADAAVRKLVGVAHRQAVAEAALVLCGPDGATADAATAEAVHQFLLTRCLSIAGGTTQILLSVVGERALGLPREEVR